VLIAFLMAGVILGVEKSQAAGWESVGTVNFGQSGALDTNIAFNPSTNEPYVAYRDYVDSYKASVMKFTNGSWQGVGNAGFSSGGASNLTLAFNPSTNEPYVAYIDDSSGMLIVKRFDAGENTWEVVSDGRYFEVGSRYLSLAFNPSTYEPYVAYGAYNNNDFFYKATVKRFTGDSWQTVGDAGFSGDLSSIILTFDPANNKPYLAYVETEYLPDDETNGKIFVKKLANNSSTWETVAVGGTELPEGDAYSPKLVFQPTTNELYLAYENYIASDDTDRVLVEKFTDGSWQAVDWESISEGNAYPPTLAFNPSTNEPYISYSDYYGERAGKATLMGFTGSNWQVVGAAGLSEGSVMSTSLAFNPSTKEPYLVYIDSVGDSYPVRVMKFVYDVAAAPTASPTGGTYTSAQSVALSTTTSGATIHYTIDGTTPTASSATYSSAISISDTTTLKAIASKSGMTDSSVMSETYTINVQDNSNNNNDNNNNNNNNNDNSNDNVTILKRQGVKHILFSKKNKRGLVYAGDVTNNSAKIVWIINPGERGEIYFSHKKVVVKNDRLDSIRMTRFNFPSPGTSHSVQISGLKRNTLYFYRVVTPSGKSRVYTFKTSK